MGKSSKVGGAAGTTGTDSAPKKSKKAKRVAHPLVGAKTGYPFESLPTDYSYTAHKPLNRKAFKNATAFLEYQAGAVELAAKRLTEKATALRGKVEMAKQFGDEESRKKVAKYLKMREQSAAMEAALTAGGLSPELLAKLQASVAKPAATA